MSEKLTPERAVRLLRAKAAELEEGVKNGFTIREDYLAADIALVAGLLADHIEDSERHDEQLRRMYEYLADKVILAETRERLTTVEVQHDASFNEADLNDEAAAEAASREWHEEVERG